MFPHGLKNKKDYPLDRLNAILDMHGALWWEVTPALRAVKIKWDDEEVRLFFYYDEKISNEDNECAECMATELISGYPEYRLEIEILRWDYPKPIPDNGGELVYHRREPYIQEKLNLKTKQHLFSQLCQKGETPNALRMNIRLAVILALIGEIYTSIRAVSVVLTEDIIRLFFYYDGEVSEEDQCSAKSIGTQVGINFPTYRLEVEAIRWDYPKMIPQNEDVESIYYRKEAYPED